MVLPLNPMASSGDPEWSAPPRVPELGPEETHVWLAELGSLEPLLPRLRVSFDEAENLRAERFRFEKDRAAFVLGRGLLRFLLGRYLGLSPERLRFALSVHGKPSVEAGIGASSLRFNLSHSADVVLIAVGVGQRLGVDVERVRTDVSLDQIAERFFSEREVAALRRLSPALRSRAFYSCWTRKEAYVKARGGGLSHPLKSFSVSLAPEDPPALLESDSGIEAWWLDDVSPAPEYAGAVASEGGGHRLRRLRVTPGLIPA